MPRAVIFDMDGMLTDSEPLWRIASVEVLNGIGAPLTEEDAVATTGLRTDELVETWQRTYPWEQPPRKVVEAMIEARVMELIRERSVPNPGVLETLAALQAAGYPLAIASSSASEVIRAGLRLLQEQDELRQIRLHELKREVREGLDEIERGEVVDGDEVFQELAERNLKFRKAKAKKK